MNKNVTKLWNREFEIVKSGLSEEQVVAFVDEIVKDQDALIQRQDNLASLTKLAERTVTEAQKLADELKKEATEQANGEVAKIIADAERRAEQIFEEKGTHIISKATEQAEAVKANAQREAETILENQKKRIQPELKNMAQRVYDHLRSELENLKGQVAVMEAELEPKLFSPSEQPSTAAAQEEPPTTDKGEVATALKEEPQAEKEEAPTAVKEEPQAANEEVADTAEKGQPSTGSYEKKVELEFQSPADLLQILEIDRHLEALPEVEATEIIPIEDKPIITVFLREPIELIDKLSALTEVSQVKEGQNGDTSAGDAPDEQFSRLQITLSGSTEAGGAKG